MKLITHIKRVFKLVGIEIGILILVLITINNFLGHPETRINADGVGYYDYLPSVFIHHDLNRKDINSDPEHPSYRRIYNLPNYVDYGDRWVNKYPIGTAVLQTPFFLSTYWNTSRTDKETDGYQPEFHMAVFHAAIFYLFVGLIFFKRLLTTYSISPWIIVISQLLVVFSTSLLSYVNFDPSFSHVNSFFAFSAFGFVVRRFFLDQKQHWLIWSFVLLGLILLIRPANLLVLLFLPFLAGSWENLKYGIRTTLFQWKTLLLSFGIIVIILSIQMFAWYYQTGHWLVDSYPNESFDFTQPHFFDILFSYRKGLFIYTPILLLGLFGIISLIFKREWFKSFSWLFAFLVLTYILSSWWSWYYGCSFGLRAYIEYYPFFFIPFGILLNQTHKVFIYIIIGSTALTSYVNLIQTYQYQAYILDWMNMDKAKFWNIFLQTEERFKGLVWKQKIDEKGYRLIHKERIGNIEGKEKISVLISRQPLSMRINSLSLIKIKFKNNFDSLDDSKIIISIDDTLEQKNIAWFSTYVIHYQEEHLNKKHEGQYQYLIEPSINVENKMITAILETNSGYRKLEGAVIEYFTKK
jgi:hypothetical protein